MGGKIQVEERWGMRFWQLISDFAHQGLPRSDVAKAIGYTTHGFYELLYKNPELDPFEDSNIVAGYVRDSGEAFSAAVNRMAGQGLSGRKIAHAVGYADWTSAKKALEARGLQVPRLLSERHMNKRYLRGEPKCSNT